MSSTYNIKDYSVKENIRLYFFFIQKSKIMLAYHKIIITLPVVDMI